MEKRTITAVIALCIFIPLVLAGHLWLDVTALVLGLFALGEILVMQKQVLVSPEALISMLGLVALIAPDRWYQNLPSFLTPLSVFYALMLLLMLAMVFTKNLFSFNRAGAIALATLYVGLGFHYFVNARIDGIHTIFYALLVVWSTDTGAYLVGKNFGTHRLAPHISPHKTWAGSLGGLILAVVIGTGFTYFFPLHGRSLLTMFWLTVILSIVSQLGDLIESAIKRHYGVKDSGNILPGHGGILDRFDSLLLVLPFLHLIGII